MKMPITGHRTSCNEASREPLTAQISSKNAVDFTSDSVHRPGIMVKRSPSSRPSRRGEGELFTAFREILMVGLVDALKKSELRNPPHGGKGI
jgi:hypothetical protein